MSIKKGDLVTVISGEARGKSGRILKIFPKAQRIIVEKVNMVKRHQRPSAEFPQGGLIEKELPISICNVALVCPRCSQVTRIQKKQVGPNMTLRACKKCGEVIDEQK